MKTWFITGASRGFGALFVKEALDRGDNVVAAARNPQVLAEKFGARPNLLAIKLDVTNEEQAREAVRQTVERFGRIDVLINNAGFGVLGAVEEISGAEVEAVYRTNVFGRSRSRALLCRNYAVKVRGTSSISLRSPGIKALLAGASMPRRSSRWRASPKDWLWKLSLWASR